MNRFILGTLVLGFTIAATNAFAQSYTSAYPTYGPAITSTGPTSPSPTYGPAITSTPAGPIDGLAGGYPGFARPGFPSTSGTGVVSPYSPGGLPGGYDQAFPMYDTVPSQPRRLGWRLFGWRRGGVPTSYVGDNYSATYP